MPSVYRRYALLIVVALLILAAVALIVLRAGGEVTLLPVLVEVAALIAVPASATVAVIYREQARKLREQKAQLENEAASRGLLLDAVPDAYVMLGPQGQIAQRKGVEKLLGLTPTLLQDVLEALAPPSAEKLMQHIRDMQAGKEEEFRIQVQLKNGSRALVAHGVRQAGGVLLWLRDISRFTDELRRQSDALGQANTQLGELRALAEALPFPVWIRARNLKLAWCNPAYAAAVSSKPEAVVGDQIELVPAAQRGKAKSLAQLAVEAQSRQEEQRFVVIEGQRRLLHITETAVGPQHLVVGYAMDVTREDELDGELKRHLKAHEEVLDLLGTPIAVYGADTRLKFYNRAYLKLWGADETFLRTEPTFNEILEDLRARRRAPEQADFQKYKKERMSLFTSLIEAREDLMHL
ncbi:MAG TPA: PAS domain-containing protein, partial [Alphaproteobacteria bacterium]|nr:PAS domain-containing protein [Alphaproteobacteria bacterium]